MTSGERSEMPDFGDIVELILKEEGHYYAKHCPGEIMIIEDAEGRDNDYDEFGIKSVIGYYGGIKDTSYRETSALVGGAISRVMITSQGGRDYYCLDQTLHRPNAIRELRFNGEGFVKVPIEYVAERRIVQRANEKMRVVN